MLIKALCDYYDALGKNGKVLPKGYSNVKIHYLVSLSLNGEIDEIINWQETERTEDGKGKMKERFVPRTIVMPERTEKPGIEANVVEHKMCIRDRCTRGAGMVSGKRGLFRMLVQSDQEKPQR